MSKEGITIGTLAYYKEARREVAETDSVCAINYILDKVASDITTKVINDPDDDAYFFQNYRQEFLSNLKRDLQNREDLNLNLCRGRERLMKIPDTEWYYIDSSYVVEEKEI